MPDAPDLAPEDFYMEEDALVFTAAYHRKRGYCCGSGCRHCPWREDAPRQQDGAWQQNPASRYDRPGLKEES